MNPSTYDKKLKDGTAVTCSVRVNLFAVWGQRERWPEKDEREVRWFTPETAAQAVDEPDLAKLIRLLDDGVGAGEPPREPVVNNAGRK